mgnify:CR=1 FL=1
MLDVDDQSRYVQSCSEAAFGYFAAANSAWMEAARRPLEMWSSALAACAPKPEPKSWYRHPDERGGAQSAVPPWISAWSGQNSPFAWFGAPGATMPAAMAWPFGWPAQFIQPWLEMVSSPRAATAWPMAFMMMSFGIPMSVARPAAEANAAAMDATRIATAAVERAFAVYRSDGGHASTHVVGGERHVMTAFLPFSGLPFLH